MEIDRNIRQVRSVPSKFETRSDDNGMHIEGYFAVFNSNYEIFPDVTESIAPEAFDNTLGGDIKALADHDTVAIKPGHLNSALILTACGDTSTSIRTIQMQSTFTSV